MVLIGSALVAEAWQRRFWPDSKQLRLVAISLKLVFFNTNVIASSLQSAQRMLGAQEGSWLEALSWLKRDRGDSDPTLTHSDWCLLALNLYFIIQMSLQVRLRAQNECKPLKMGLDLRHSCGWSMTEADSKQVRQVAISLKFVFYKTNVIASSLESAQRMQATQDGSWFEALSWLKHDRGDSDPTLTNSDWWLLA